MNNTYLRAQWAWKINSACITAILQLTSSIPFCKSPINLSLFSWIFSSLSPPTLYSLFIPKRMHYNATEPSVCLSSLPMWKGFCRLVLKSTAHTTLVRSVIDLQDNYFMSFLLLLHSSPRMKGRKRQKRTNAGKEIKEEKKWVGGDGAVRRRIL